MLTFLYVAYRPQICYIVRMKPIALPAEAILKTADREKALKQGLAYTEAVARGQANTAQVMLQTLAFSAQAADTAPMGTVQRQREFQNVKIMAEASDIVTKGLMDIAKVMAGFTAPHPHIMVNQQFNIQKPPRMKREEAPTIDAEAPAYSIFD
mgnify:FL=1